LFVFAPNNHRLVAGKSIEKIDYFYEIFDYFYVFFRFFSKRNILLYNIL